MRSPRHDKPDLFGHTDAAPVQRDEPRAAPAPRPDPSPNHGLDPEQLRDVMSQRWPMQRFNEGAIFFIEFNHRADRLTRNKRRLALHQALIL